MILAAALLWGGCGRQAAPMVDAGAPAPDDAAPAPDTTRIGADPVDRLTQEQDGLPLPTGEDVWGVSVPHGCTAVEAFETWVGFACRPTADELGRYYRFRFPAVRVSTDGTALVVRPDSERQGYARVQRVRKGANRSRLVVFRGRAPADDEGAARIKARLRPTAAPPRSGRSEASEGH